ncbi:MAG: GGDEF domain-containing protein [Eubacteriaceae bacterium]
MNRPVSLVMDNDPLIANYYSDIIDVANLAMSRKADKLYNSIVIEKNGNYYGVVSINNLLNKFINLQIELAKNTNPLTKLPGNTAIHNLLADIIKYEKNHTLLYIDIDRFKLFNDQYGTIKGDEFICLVAQCIQKSANEYPNKYVFTGHVGGDDYIVIAEEKIALQLAQKILQIFKEDKNTYLQKYCDIDKDVFISTTLSIAMVEITYNKFSSPREIGECAAKVKKICKSIKGNCIVKNKDIKQIN